MLTIKYTTPDGGFRLSFIRPEEDPIPRIGEEIQFEDDVFLVTKIRYIMRNNDAIKQIEISTLIVPDIL